MLISIEKAKEIALHYLNVEWNTKYEFALFEDKIVSFEEGFLIAFNTKEYIVNNNSHYEAMGFMPLIVGRVTGKVFYPNGNNLRDNQIINMFLDNKIISIMIDFHGASRVFGHFLLSLK